MFYLQKCFLYRSRYLNIRMCKYKDNYRDRLCGITGYCMLICLFSWQTSCKLTKHGNQKYTK